LRKGWETTSLHRSLFHQPLKSIGWQPKTASVLSLKFITQKAVILSERSESKDLHFVQDGSTQVVRNLLRISETPH
jgi:hypothetical protein